MVLINVRMIVVSVLHCIQATHALNGAWDENTLSLSVPYASLAMTLNVLLVVCLLWRLVDLRRRVPPTLKPETKANYFSVETIIVESALPYGIASFIFLVLYGVRNIGANLFLSLIVQLEVCPYLLKRKRTGQLPTILRSIVGYSLRSYCHSHDEWACMVPGHDSAGRTP